MPWYTAFVMARETWIRYARILKSHPVCAQSATSAVGMLIGDGIAQWATGESDNARAATMASWSAVIAAPASMTWSKVVAAQSPGRSRKYAVLNAVARQAIVPPIVASCICWSMATDSSGGAATEEVCGGPSLS
jgi:hypothetical protein